MSWLGLFQKLRESHATPADNSCGECGKLECECSHKENDVTQEHGIAFYGMKAFTGLPDAPPKMEADAGSSMPQFFRSFPKKEAAPKGVDAKKWDDCVKKVADKGNADSAYAVCTASMTQKEAANGPKSNGSGNNQPAKSAGSSAFSVRTKLRESVAGASGDPVKFKAVLIQEGLGNLRDGYFYTAQALEGAAALFEGKKIYVNHPDSVEEMTRPERKVQDILGYYENVQAEKLDDGRTILTANLCIMPDPAFDWARSLMEHSIDFAQKYPGRDLIGLSINAEGDSDEQAFDEFLTNYKVPQSALPKLNEAKAMGMTSIKVVNAITKANSADMVTEAGAGGRILSMA